MPSVTDPVSGTTYSIDVCGLNGLGKILRNATAGAGTVIGATSVARAAPDGYTLLMSSGTTFTVNPAVRAKLPYDPVKSF